MMSHKKIHRFLLTALPPVTVGQTITITDEQKIHQIHRVLRLAPGETIAVFCDGGHTVIGEIISIDKKQLTLHVSSIEEVAQAKRTVIAAISIPKGDTFELITQKLTELGVTTIVPLVSSRTVKQQVRLDRLQVISDEALEQSGGTKRVHITEPKTLQDCLAAYPFQKVVFDPLTPQAGLGTYRDTIVCFVGPEGGWSEEDEQLFTEAGCEHLRITDRVLRTETAAIIGVYTLLWA